MKKALIIIGIAVVVLLAAIIAVPVFFKDTLIEKTQTAVNNNINAEVDFADIKLSLFRNFPKVTVVIEEAVVTGKGDFQNDTLLDVNSVGLKMSLLSLIRSSDRSIEEIELIRPRLYLLVNDQENANWDIVQAGEEQSTSGEDGGALNLQLEEIVISDAQIVYDDRAAKTLLRFEDVNLNLNGEMYGTSARLRANGRIDRFNLNYDGSNFISNVSLETETLLDINYETITIDILENDLLVNRLPLTVTGSIQALGDTIHFDLGMKAQESGFENFLALVPPEYEHYLEDMDATGDASFSGTFNGFYYEDSYPALNLILNISGGNLHYADLPEEIQNINADATISKPQGVWDLTEVKITEAHAEIRNNPVDLTLTLTNLVSDPWFDGAFVGNVNLEHLKNALPLESVDMTGTIDANLFVTGNYSAIENEQYAQIEADGIVLLSNYTFQSPDLTQPIYIPQGQMDFSPESINLSEFDMRVGQSNFNFTGAVSNYLNYYFGDGDLRGTLQLNSPQVNLNELFLLQTNTGNDSLATDEATLAFDIPDDIDITFQSNIQRAVFDRLPITNINGLITAQSGRLVLNDLSMNMLDGQLGLSGSYQNTPENQPLFDFGLNISEFDIPTAYNTLTSVRRMLPVAGDSRGRFSSTMKLNGQLSDSLKLIPSTVDGSGVFSTQDVRIVGSPIFTQISGLLNQEMLQNVVIDDFSANFTIENGNLLIRPFTTRLAGQETTVSGSLNTENLIDMQLAFQVQRNAFGQDIQNILSALPGQENIQVLPASVEIQGPVGNPDVNVDLSEARQKITEEIKRSAGEGLKNTLDKLGDGLRNIFQ